MDESYNITPVRKYYCESASTAELCASLLAKYERNGMYLSGLVRCVWGKIFRRDLIEFSQARFKEGLYIGEDACFLLNLMQYIEPREFGVINEYGYYYRRHGASAVHRYKKDLYEQLILQEKVCREMLVVQFGKDFPEPVQSAYAVFLWIAYFSLGSNFYTGVRNGTLKYWQSDVDSRKWLERYGAEMCIHACKKRIVREVRFEWKCYKIHRALARVTGKWNSIRLHLLLDKCIIMGKLLFPKKSV